MRSALGLAVNPPCVSARAVCNISYKTRAEIANLKKCVKQELRAYEYFLFFSSVRR